MIIRRQSQEPSKGKKEVESIQSKLSRLRFEQRTTDHRLPPISSSTSTSTLRTPSLPYLYSTPTPSTSTSTEQRRKAPGPPPPPSWTTTSNLSSASSSTKGKERAKEDTLRRQILLLPLSSSPSYEESTSWESLVKLSTPRVLSLRVICCFMIAQDLQDLGSSIYLDYLDFIPSQLRIQVMEVGAIYSPLSAEGVGVLLQPEEMEEDEVIATPPSLEATEEGNEWDTLQDGITDYFPFPSNLTSLNLCGSLLSLSQLRRLLLSPPTSSSPLPSISPQRPILLFPNLISLNLSSTPNIIYRRGFFELLSFLPSLRHLSIAGNDPYSPSNALPGSHERWLIRLSVSTPNLISLDISFISPYNVSREAVVLVDWENQWLSLRTLGVRSFKGERRGILERECKEEREIWVRSLGKEIWDKMGSRKRGVELVT